MSPPKAGQGTKFDNCDLDDAIFDAAKCVGIKLNNSRLTYANFFRTVITLSDLTNSDFTSSKFTIATLTKSDLRYSDLNNVDFSTALCEEMTFPATYGKRAEESGENPFAE